MARALGRVMGRIGNALVMLLILQRLQATVKIIIIDISDSFELHILPIDRDP